MEKIKKEIQSTKAITSARATEIVRKINHKSIYEEGFYIYMFVDIDGNIIYLGSSNRVAKRISRHLNGNEHLYIPTEDWFNIYRLKEVVYLDVTKIIKNYDELHYLESLFIANKEPRLNNKWNNDRDRIVYYADKVELDTRAMIKVEEYFWGVEEEDFYSYDFNINRNYNYLTSNNIIKIA